MISVDNYIIGLLCCIYCCVCWGSWSNTQKKAVNVKSQIMPGGGRQARCEWTAELFYWDFSIGHFLTGVLGTLTLGSLGSDGQTFMENLSMVDTSSVLFAMFGGVIWNMANVFLSSAISVAGMSVAFPIGGGLGWIGGIVFNFVLIIISGQQYSGNLLLLWGGVAIIVIAMYINAKAYGMRTEESRGRSLKGILLSLASGIGFMFFYGFVVRAISPEYISGGMGVMTPYTAVFFFGLGAFVSTPLFNGFAMRYPSLGGEPKTMRDYLSGDMKTHFVGILGGVIWMSGMVISFMGSGAANPAISYALSNASPVVAILWGLFVWKEFNKSPRLAVIYIKTSFILFIIGLICISLSH